jgi:CTP:molybdopterin cytidylyltransferase MocA
MAPTLLVLAAGMGSRYGGLKQIDPVGPAGETVLDYGVYDAIRAGFTRVVFVIRKEFEEEFRTKVTAKYSGRIAVDFVFQSTADLPEGFSVPRAARSPGEPATPSGARARP